jgi:hypothetical protein
LQREREREREYLEANGITKERNYLAALTMPFLDFLFIPKRKILQCPYR